MPKDDTLPDGKKRSELGRHKKYSVFKIADFRIIRKAKNYCAEVKEIPKENYVIFLVEGIEVIAKKNIHGNLVLDCPCDFCGIKGKIKGIQCGRCLSVYKYLFHHNGRITEVDIAKRFWKQ